VTASATWSVPAVPDEIGPLRRAVARYAADQSVADPPMTDLKLALSEAITNAVVHAFPTGEPGTITVLVSVAEHDVTVTVTDDGRGLRPRSDSPGGGLGLTLIATVARTAQFSVPPGGQGTSVRMTFGLGEPGRLN